MNPLKAPGQERGVAPEPGLFRLRLVKGGPYVAAEIRHEPTRDPVTGEALDRSYFWYAIVNGQRERDAPGPVPSRMVAQIWMFGEKIGRAEYDWLLQDRAWAKRWAADSPEANPYRKIDLGKEPVAF